jgi:hypothetical protein
MRSRVVFPLPLLFLAGVVCVTGCATPAAPPASSSASNAPPVVASSTSSAPPLSSVEPSVTPTDYKVTFGFGVPSGTVSVAHPFTPPPLRTLVGVFAGNHPTDSPAYQRMSFYFRGGYPSYKVSYVPRVVADGSGAGIPLPGNAFLQVVFTDAQAHTAAGASSVTSTPPATIGYANLKGYAPAGDFEGHVTYGLGLQTLPNFDQILSLRLGELTKSDGSGGTYYVVFVDIKSA